MRKIMFFVILLMCFASSCNSAQSVNQKNFKSVLNKYLAKNSAVIFPVFFTIKAGFPLTVKLTEVKRVDEQRTRQFDALVSAGLLKVKDGILEREVFGDKQIIPTKTYTLTRRGEKLLVKVSRELAEDKIGFRFAIYQVDKIINFSKPAQNDIGQKVSHVNYSVSPINIEEWTNNEKIQKAFPDLQKKLKLHQKQSAILVLMNNGWIHQNDINF